MTRAINSTLRLLLRACRGAGFIAAIIMGMSLMIGIAHLIGRVLGK